MNTSTRNLPEPSIAFTVLSNQAIDADASLDWNPNGARLQIHEVWGANRYCVTLGQPKLQVTFEVEFAYLIYLEQAFRAYRERLQSRGGGDSGSVVSKPLGIAADLRPCDQPAPGDATLL